MMRAPILAFAMALAAAPACADELAAALRHGASGDYHRIGASLRLGALWNADWGNWRAALHPELEVGRIRYHGSRPGADHLDQGGAVALFRVVREGSGLRPYAEIGVGAALFSRTSLGNKDFSTRFQFSEHLGLGVELPRGFSVGWRFSHYSNADLKLPNDGIDFHQIVIGARF